MILRFRRKKRFRRQGLTITDVLVAILVISIAVYLAWWEDKQVMETTGQTNHIEGWAEIDDGDSIRINGKRIRIVGIDAPELYQYCDKDGQKFACGQYATDYLRRLIGRLSVTCRWIEKDQYNRILGHCFAGETDLNRTMVLDGWATSYSSYPLEEREARKHQRGMWQWNVERPRDWRRVHPRQNIKQP